MNRLSFRPRPLDIHKKLPIVKSIKDFEDDEAGSIAAASTRNSQLLRIASETDNEAHQPPVRKNSSEIPTPQYSVVDTYERDYTCTFSQPTSYLRVRGARAEIGDFVEYDLDNEDEDWLEDYNSEKKNLAPEKLEALLFKLEVLDHKTRERAGIVAPTFGSHVPVLLQPDAAAEALQAQQNVRFTVFRDVYEYWKGKRERWQKPILRRLQPPPPVNDTNPYNVFRPREKVHRLHTRRMQRRENNVQSFDKLRQVRRNLEQAKTVLEATIKREEKKREVLECEVNLQRFQIKYKNEAQLIEDGLFQGYPSNSYRYDTSDDDDLTDSDDETDGYRRARSAAAQKTTFVNFKQAVPPTTHAMRELKQRRLQQYKWPQKKDPDEPVFLFTKPLDLAKLTSLSITPPKDPPIENGSASPPFRFKGRIGRGGRIIFDRWKPDSNLYFPPKPNG